MNQQLPDIIPHIIYLIPVEDGDPFEASPLQGFARSLLNHSPLIDFVSLLPSDIIEPSLDLHETLLPRRMAGQAPIRWFGQSPKALSHAPTPPFSPFVVLLLGPEHNFKDYKAWIDLHTFPLTVLSKEDGTINYEDFSLDILNKAFLAVCSALKGQVSEGSRLEAIEFLNGWKQRDERELGYQVGGHNTVSPNLAALRVAGFVDMVHGEFLDNSRGNQPYIDQISKTTRSILDERHQVGFREGNRLYKQTPSINLFLPSIYPHFKELSLTGAPMSADERKRFTMVRNALNRQDGYAFEARTKAQAEAVFGKDVAQDDLRPHYLMVERAKELRFSSECVGCLAASEFAAVIRLPNAVNRTAGQVRQFAQQQRSKKQTDRKRIDMFRKVQRTITDSVAPELIELVAEVNGGVRIIADAHLEWLNIKGLPLCIQKETSRIPVTPGNLFVEQVSAKNLIELSTRDFREVLILSALSKDDPIGPFFDHALGVFAKELVGKVNINTVRVRNKADLADALFNFRGAMVIFDGHGSHHEGQAATLQLLDEKVNIWELRDGFKRVPPIIILSACDTHAADRNHASTGNGFLSLGATSVLSSVFPLKAVDAATFVARLLHRVANYVPAAHKMLGRSVTWSEIISGMNRMVLLTDFLRRLRRKKMIDELTYREIHLAGNIAINSLEDWPFEGVIQSLEAEGINEKTALRELQAATSDSAAISYLHLGRPETILIHPSELQEAV